jgi:hypothetical protein
MIGITSDEIRSTGTLDQGFLARRDLTSDEIAFLARADKVRSCTTAADIHNGGCRFVAAAVYAHPQSNAQYVAIWEYNEESGVDGLSLLRGDQMQAAINEIEARHAEIAQIEADQGHPYATDFPAVDTAFLRAAVDAARVGRSIRRNEVA